MRNSERQGNRSSPIGIFDSGLGGLTVVRQVFEVLPRESVVYFGDTARVPYGTKSEETVIRFSLQDARFLSNFHVKVLVVACHTASALSLGELQRSFSVPVIGVIEPGCLAAIRAMTTGRIGVIGTDATISSGAYESKLKELSPEVTVTSRACPLFVPLVEEGWLSHEVTRMVAREYLAPLKGEGIDTLILACTHYGLLKDVIGEEMGQSVTLVDPAKEVGVTVREKLQSHELLRSTPMQPEHLFYVSDIPQKFKKTAELFLGRQINEVELVSAEDY